MSERTFPEQRIEAGGVTAVAYRIECSSCAAVGFYPQKRIGIRRPLHSIAEHFRGMKWSVGSGARKDLCPECARRRKPKKEKVMADMTAAAKPQADNPRAEKPREMTRDDRRIINDKLDEVYGKDCYKSPWCDAMVAKDLGVPRDWVAQVRDQFFGPEGSNPLFDEYLTARDEVERHWCDVKAAHDAVMKALDEFRPAYHAAHQSLESLRLLGRRIERELGR
ncbi:hypothetical protein [Neorhizobium petrolearium]|uniref:Uncharacterized protein n=1 Tax=Neorhizobium petrolearium TaxID=515361 RepID=A0ABY8M4L3_9HYPH|nr:hypothetical protein [Neorhizobium petrolearium]MCC2608372.1 hypothetical protein [Neorhizobium petrolearium]WGI68651.1 hypothetical protein QEO92_00690 [Neorhizobium petrolearium]